MKTVTVSASRRYDILIERGLLRRAGELVRGVTNAGTVMLARPVTAFISFRCLCVWPSAYWRGAFRRGLRSGARYSAIIFLPPPE